MELTKEPYFFVFPSPFVWWTKVENHEDIKNKYLPMIEEDYKLNGNFYNAKNKWNCKVTSSFFSGAMITSIFDNYFYTNVVWNTLDKMIEQLNSNINLPIPNQSNLEQIWYNKYQAGHWQEIHDHASTKNQTRTFSGIYLIDVNEKNNTVFHQRHHINCFSSQLSSFSTHHIEEGSVIWFPAELAHYVNPTSNERTTIAFNVNSSYGNLSSS